MADYNVNMKQWNGTSFDNVLPLAYNAKQLGGQSLAEVKQWVVDNAGYSMSYVGNGQYGVNNPTTLTFPFIPKFILIQPLETDNEFMVTIPNGISLGQYSTAKYYKNVVLTVNSSSATVGLKYFLVWVKVDGKTFSIYSTSPKTQFNVDTLTYSVFAI